MYCLLSTSGLKQKAKTGNALEGWEIDNQRESRSKNVKKKNGMFIDGILYHTFHLLSEDFGLVNTITLGPFIRRK